MAGKSIVGEGKDPLHSGSNTDLDSIEQIEHDLRFRSAQMDEALEELRSISERHPKAVLDYERAYLLAHIKGSDDDKVAVRDSKARLASLSEKHDLGMIEAKLAVAKVALKTRDSQLSAVQTMASLLKTQMELDRSAR